MNKYFHSTLKRISVRSLLLAVSILSLAAAPFTANAASISPLRLPVIAAAASAVQVTDLGVLPGGDYSTARAINNSGQVVGLSTDSAHEYQTVIWNGGSIITIDKCCTGGLPRLEGINNLREVVGWENGGYATNGIYWDALGKASVLPALPGGENRVYAYDINNSGLIVGVSRDGTLDRHAVVWDRTTLFRDLGFMGAASPGFANFSSARGLNDLGEIVGQALIGSDYHAFLWRNGSFTDLGLGYALDINNTGLIAGWTSGQIPVVWQNGVMQNLPGISGEAIGYGHIVTGINNNGDVVGYAPSPVGTGFRYTAVLWRGGKAINLGFFPGGTSSIAYDINDSGQIIGEGSIVPDGPMHALMWTVGGVTPGPTSTPVPPTPTSTPVAGTSTGFLSPSANAAQTSSAGDNNGYQSSAANAYVDDSAVATDTNSGTNTNISCTNNGKDKHSFYNYNFNLPVNAVIKGIQVRLDARVDATSGTPKICAQLSWDGGLSWTTAKSTTNLGTTEATFNLGGVSDTWGRTWAPVNFDNANFRIRLIDVSSNSSRDFFLDYIAVNVTYQP